MVSTRDTPTMKINVQFNRGLLTKQSCPVRHTTTTSFKKSSTVSWYKYECRTPIINQLWLQSCSIDVSTYCISPVGEDWRFISLRYSDSPLRGGHSSPWQPAAQSQRWSLWSLLYLGPSWKLYWDREREKESDKEEMQFIYSQNIFF